MKVKLELLLTRTVTVEVTDSDLDDLNRLVRLVQGTDQDIVHAMKIVEMNGGPVGTSLDSGSALEVSTDQNMVKFRQIVPVLLQKLRKSLNKNNVDDFELGDWPSNSFVIADDEVQTPKPTTDHIESISRDTAWKDMNRARRAGHSMFGGRY